MWNAILAEALEDHTFFLLAGLVITNTLARIFAPEERDRLRTVQLLALVHFALLPLLAALQGSLNPTAPGLRLASLVVGALAGVGMMGTLVFGILLPRIRLRAPLILRDLVSAILAVVSIIFLANQAGFPLSGVITTSAVLTAIIGFSLQDTLGNIMGGLALQVDKSIQVGNWIKVGDTVGQVTEIRWRYTAIETRNWETVVMANSVLVKSQVTVLGKRLGQAEQVRRWVWFNVDFRYSPAEVISTIEEALRVAPIPNVATIPSPNCVLMDLGESFGRYAIRYWLTDLRVDDPTDSEVRTRAYFALKRASIPLSIPAHANFVTQESEERRTVKDRSDRERRIEALRRVELFEHLPQEDHEKMADGLRYAPFTRGEVMTRQGAEGHWLYMIISGRGSVRITADTGIEKEVACLGAGDFFGEVSLMTGSPRTATVVAITNVECFRLDKATFQEVVRRRPELAQEIAAILARRKLELDAVKEGLDAQGRKRHLEETEHALLTRIRDFFGLSGTTSAKN